MKKLGLLAIGQSPRPDFTPIIQSLVPDVLIVEKGVLDGLTKDDLARLAPDADEHPVISRLRDGGSAVLSKPLLTERLNGKLEEFAEEGVDAAVLMCTGEFHGVVRPEGLTLLFGKQIIDHCVQAAVPAGAKLGVLVPLASQEKFAREKFAAMGYAAATAHASPYGPVEDVKKAAEAFRGCAAVILHCMGYDNSHRKVVAEASGAMVMASSSLVGHVCAELLAGGA